MIESVANWLSSTSLNAILGTHLWVTPAVQTIHILAIALIMSAILLTDLRVLGAIGQDVPTRQFSARYLPWIGAALLTLLLSGTVLIVGEPHRSLGNQIFYLKMGLLILAIAVTAAIHWPVLYQQDFWRPLGRRIALRSLAVLSLGIWISIVFAGRWIAYSY